MGGVPDCRERLELAGYTQGSSDSFGFVGVEEISEMFRSVSFGCEQEAGSLVKMC